MAMSSAVGDRDEDGPYEVVEAAPFHFDDSHTNSSERGDESSNHSVARETDLVQQLTLKEQKDVWTWKFLVFSGLWLCAGFLGMAGKGFVLRNQQRDFETEVSQIGTELESDLESSIDRFQLSLSNFGSWITSRGPSRWYFPQVVLRNWELQGMGLRGNVPAIQDVAWCPFVEATDGRDNDFDVWNSFVVAQSKKWLQESIETNSEASNLDLDLFKPELLEGSRNAIYALPRWQVSPPTIDPSILNKDVLEDQSLHDLYQAVFFARQGLFGPRQESTDLPFVTWMEPVYYDLFNVTSEIAGIVVANVSMTEIIRDLLPLDELQSFELVLRSSCGTYDTFQLRGSELEYMGNKDLHDPKFQADRQVLPLYKPNELNPSLPGQCFYSLHAYPTEQLARMYFDPTTPNVVLSLIILVFVGMTIVFIIYDRMEANRNRKVVATAAKANQIVQQLFPTMVQHRLFDSEQDVQEEEYRQSTQDKTKTTLRSILDGGDVTEVSTRKANPIADLYPNTTIMFADMKGFTAWSSVRQPSDVFQLLETVYAAFDKIAKRRRIFKVETIGDCYVAVCGLPDPRKDHAVLMCRFARDCLRAMRVIVRDLGDNMGPDTMDLQLRVGLHSGQVTAGVLRGDRARFQLFGDTMNTASRMESTGVPDKIHISEQTAKLVMDSGKDYWITRRSDTVVAKGKGELVTYFLKDSFVGFKNARSRSSDQSEDHTMSDTEVNLDDGLDFKKDRIECLISWASDLLVNSFDQRAQAIVDDPWKDANTSINNDVFEELSTDLDFKPNYGAIDSLSEDKKPISRKVRDQTSNFVRAIASLHEPNHFHNFEHAAHVTMSISKLMSRIVGQCSFNGNDNDIVVQLSCDPLLRSACIIAGLVHDLLHPGVPNATLVKEGVSIAKKYNGRCVAERNALDVAWDLLMEERFRDLRLALCSTKEDVFRFRKFLVHLVLATDIMDGGLRDLYASRWSQVFQNDRNTKLSPSSQSTLVLQHLIQASDVSHTMQHWEIYIKWNERLFAEMCESYKKGRQSWDPVVSWYEGEISFFDNYVIPLAEKLRTCGVFGASSDEYLTYARRNRVEWERRGPGIVNEMLQNIEKKAIVSPPPSPVKRLLFKLPNVKDSDVMAEFAGSILDLDFSISNEDDPELEIKEVLK